MPPSSRLRLWAPAPIECGPAARASRPEVVCSEPSVPKPKAGKNKAPPKRGMPKVKTAPREHS